jgi:DNA-damage-inducible protein D
MKNKVIEKKQSVFEQIRHTNDNGTEYWTAREMAKALEYVDYRNFLSVVEKAKEACANSGQNVDDNFADASVSLKVGVANERIGEDVLLSRYACYLVIQNADPSKEVVANGQTYFAVQTRIAEIKQMEQYEALRTEDEKRVFLRKELRQHNAQLADAASNAGIVTNIDYAIFQNHGYMGLYGGLDAKGIARKKGIGGGKSILDYMGSTELAANLFRATQTEEKLRREQIKDKQEANKTHYDVGAKVRKTIKDIGGAMPEDLPIGEDVKKVERRTKSEKKKSIAKNPVEKKNK